MESTDRVEDGPSLARIDAALIGLRHLWSTPPQVPWRTSGTIDMSTIWIVEALTRYEQVAGQVPGTEPGRSERGRTEPGPDIAPAMTIGDLAIALDVAHSTASRLVARARASGAVERHPSQSDTRKVTVHLTDAGRDLARTARAFRHEYLEAATSGWTDLERASFADLLARFADSVVAFDP